MIKKNLKKLLHGMFSIYVKLNRKDRHVDWTNLKLYKKNLINTYYGVFGREPNLKNPKLFSEKMQWLRIHDNIPLKTELSDKILVRDWVEKKIGNEYLVPLLGVYNCPEEINYDTLPNAFVIKTNHGCAYNIIVKTKNEVNKDEINNQLRLWLKENYFYHSGEWQYKDIQPRILIEEYIPAMDSDLPDYKFFCFNGCVYYCLYICNRSEDSGDTTFYDCNWNNQEFTYWGKQITGNSIPKPKNYDKMIELATILCKDFKHVRVDLYNIDGKILFGEMTFTCQGGWTKFNKPEWDLKLGNVLNLN